MFKKVLILFSFLVFVVTGAFAGTTGKISGTVVDKETGEPLPGVNIVIEGTTMGAATDNNGAYYILNVPPGTYSVVASMIGYQKEKVTGVRVSADLTTEVNFRLSSTVVELGEAVTVVAERPLIQKDMTASQSLVGAEEIDNTAVNSFESVMIAMPGFVVAGGSEGGTVSVAEGGGIHVRGGRGGQLGFMIDGFYVEDALYGGIGSDVTRDGIQELSVITGTFNAEYGEALSGVVNIVTKEGGSKLEGKLRFATDELMIGKLGDIKENNWRTTRMEASIGGPVPGTNNKVRFFFSGDRNYTNTYLNITKHVVRQDVEHFTIPDSIVDIFVDENNFVQTPTPDNIASLRKQKQVAGAEHYHNNNTFNRRWRGTGKITITPNANMKLILGFTGTRQEYKNYSQAFKPNPDRAGWTKADNLMTNFTWNHTLSPSTFYTLRGAVFTIWNRFGRFKPHDQIVQPLRSGPFSNFPFAAFGGQSNYEFLGAYPDPTGATVVINGDTLRAPAYSEENDDQNYRSQTITFNFDVTSQISRYHQIKTGFEFKQLDLRNHIINGIKTSNDTTLYRFKPIQLAAYIQDKIEFKDMVINIGLRWDYLDPKSPYVATTNDLTRQSGRVEQAKKKIHLSPRLGFGYPITDRAVLHFAYGMFTQNPDYNFFYRGIYRDSPLYPFPDIAEHFIVGNANLKPERTTAYEIGTELLLSDDIAMDVTLFYKDIYDYVSTKYFPFAQPQDYFTFVNEDYANARGIEISIEKRFSNYFSARINYTYSRAEGNSQSEFTHFNEYINASVLQEVPPKKTITLAWDQPHTLNFIIDVRKPNDWGLNIYGRFGSGLPYTPTDGRGRLTDERNSARLPWNGTIDVRLNKDFNFMGLRERIFVDITNLFNKRNVFSVFSSTGSPTFDLIPGRSEEFMDRPHWFGPPRHIEAGIQIVF
ncbi:MAG: TonB-dependent receptor [candidate division KSB1 bacterium]|nr:TonB-dependent receptor [candidate division KSB1 bacterium]MDQ7064282.1 TonB-dependent receptor [candidate division KSB1 bacterium]